VIVNASVNASQVDYLLRILRLHHKATEYTLDDLKGIHPSLCMHCILMEDDYKPLIEHERRSNCNMQHVVKKEILKLLKARIIYLISDCELVSLVHVVPKKGGTMIVKNENNKLIPTRTVISKRMCKEYRKLNKATCKDDFPLPFID